MPNKDKAEINIEGEIGKILQETYHKVGGRVEAKARIMGVIREKHFNDCMSAKKSGYDEGKAEMQAKQKTIREALEAIQAELLGDNRMYILLGFIEQVLNQTK